MQSMAEKLSNICKALDSIPRNNNRKRRKRRREQRKNKKRKWEVEPIHIQHCERIK